MSEEYRIVDDAHAEPLPAGRVGVRVRVQLSGYPSRRWSRALSARLVNELAGHAAIGHLRLNVNDIVQGDQIVLEGVERSEAAALAHGLDRAIDAANKASIGAPDQTSNVAQREADAVARELDGRSP